MGAGCCKPDIIPEVNPDGSPKDVQTAEQMKQDAVDLRQAAKDGDVAKLETVLRRATSLQINSLAGPELGPEEKGQSALHISASIGHLKAVKMLIRYGHGVDVRSSIGKTAFFYATENGRRNVMEYVLKKHADPNIQDNMGETALLHAMKDGYKDMVAWMLRLQGDRTNIELADKQRLFPALVAARNGWMECLDILIAKMTLGKTDEDAKAALVKLLNSTSKDDKGSILGWVLKYGAGGIISPTEFRRLVAMLLEAGCSAVQQCFVESIPPVALAAASGMKEVLQQLLDAGANLKATDGLKRNVLHYAAARGQVAMVEHLVQEGLAVGARDKQGNTATHLAAFRGQSSVVGVLLQKVDSMAEETEGKKKLTAAEALMEPNRAGLSILHLALSSIGTPESQRNALVVLEKAGPAALDSVVRDKNKDTLLLLAVKAHQHLVVAELLKKGADANKPNAKGETPLAVNFMSVTKATADNDGSIFNLLVDNGVSIEPQEGVLSPLLAVCMNSQAAFTEKAIKAMAQKCGGKLDYNVKDFEGRTPLMLAALYSNAWMVKNLLEVEKVNMNDTTDQGETALMLTCGAANIDCLKVLLNNTTDLDTLEAKDANGRTALAHCLKTDTLDALRAAYMLLRSGASPEDCTDKTTGETVLLRAIRHGYQEFVDLWISLVGSTSFKASKVVFSKEETKARQQEQKEKMQRQKTLKKSGAKAAPEPPSKPDNDLDLPAGHVDALDEAMEPLEVEEDAADVIEGDDEDMEDIVEATAEQGKADPDALLSKAGGAADAEGEGSGGGIKAIQGEPKKGKKGGGEDGEDEEDEEADFDDEGREAGPVGEASEAAKQRLKRLLPKCAWAMSERQTKWWDNWWDNDDVLDLQNDQDVFAASSGNLWMGEEDMGIFDVDDDDIVAEVMEAEDKEAAIRDLLRRHGCEIGDDEELEDALNLPSTGLGMAQAVAEGKVAAAPEEPDTPAKAQARMQARFGTVMKITDPYYQEETRYQGTPKYMQGSLEVVSPAKIEEMAQQVLTRGKAVDAFDEPTLRGYYLKERNMKSWNLGLSPSEFPLKPGQWKKVAVVAHKKRIAAAKAIAKGKAPKGPRDKSGVLGRLLARNDLPDETELKETTPLIFAVRMGRLGCAKSILATNIASVNVADGHGCTPLQYAMLMLARDRTNKVMAQMVDMLLAVGLPEPGNKIKLPNSTVMHPLVLATLMADHPRICFIVRKLGASLETGRVLLPEVPTYVQGLFQETAGPCATYVLPIHLAVLHKNMELVRLMVGLGAKVNSAGLPEAAVKTWEKEKKRLAKEVEKEEKRMTAAKKLKDEAKKKNTEGGKRLYYHSPSVVEIVTKVKDAILAFSMFAKPHGYVTPLSLTARLGLAEMCHFLIQKGALVAGHPVAPKSPLQEALAYARKNFRVFNLGAARPNWEKVKGAISDVPPPNPIVIGKLAAKAAGVLSGDFVQLGIVAVKMLAKAVVAIITAMRKKPIVHYDPAIATAHVLLKSRCVIPMDDAQVQIMLKDMFDNDTYDWVGVRPVDPKWMDEAHHDVVKGYAPFAMDMGGEELKKMVEKMTDSSLPSGEGDPEKGLKQNWYKRIFFAIEPADYAKERSRFFSNVDVNYMRIASKTFLEAYTKESDKFAKEQLAAHAAEKGCDEELQDSILSFYKLRQEALDSMLKTTLSVFSKGASLVAEVTEFDETIKDTLAKGEEAALDDVRGALGDGDDEGEAGWKLKVGKAGELAGTASATMEGHIPDSMNYSKMEDVEDVEAYSAEGGDEKEKEKEKEQDKEKEKEKHMKEAQKKALTGPTSTSHSSGSMKSKSLTNKSKGAGSAPEPIKVAIATKEPSPEVKARGQKRTQSLAAKAKAAAEDKAKEAAQDQAKELMGGVELSDVTRDLARGDIKGVFEMAKTTVDNVESKAGDIKGFLEKLSTTDPSQYGDMVASFSLDDATDLMNFDLDKCRGLQDGIGFMLQMFDVDVL